MNKFKLSIIYGSIAGAIMIFGWGVSSYLLNPNENGKYDFTTGEYLGYAAMLLALSAVFFGIKKYRDKELGGYIKFRQGLLMGMYIVLVTSIIYVIGWSVYYPNFMPDFSEQYTEYQIEQYKLEGLSDLEIEAKTKEMEEWMELYKDPLIMAGITFLEIFPIGMLVAFLSAFLLRKKATHDLMA